MSVQITLSDELYQRAKQQAQLKGLDVDTMIAQTLDLSLSPLSPYSPMETIDSLSDAEIIALAESKMDAVQNTRMTALLDKQQADKMTDEERSELQSLMKVYDAGQLRKAQAMVESVKRGLHLSLES